AAERAGSLITGRMGLEQNREAFAVPGSPMDPRAGGTNALLKDGAHIATGPEDVLQVLDSLRLSPLRDPPGQAWSGDSPAEPEIGDGLRAEILENLSHVPVPVDALIRAVNAPAGHVLTILLELELAGRIERQPGNKVNLI